MMAGFTLSYIRSLRLIRSRQHVPQGDLSTHVLVETAVFVVAGALLLATIAAIRNWFVQRP
jgi:UPF0716 family protein affecting phage T7 exclusion